MGYIHILHFNYFDNHEIHICDATFRAIIGFDHVTVQKVVEQKQHKTINVRQKKKRRVLPPVLQGLMGEANLRFAKGEVDLAAKICMEIIRQVVLVYHIDVQHLVKIFM